MRNIINSRDILIHKVPVLMMFLSSCNCRDKILKFLSRFQKLIEILLGSWHSSVECNDMLERSSH